MSFPAGNLHVWCLFYIVMLKITTGYMGYVPTTALAKAKFQEEREKIEEDSQRDKAENQKCAGFLQDFPSP